MAVTTSAAPAAWPEMLHSSRSETRIRLIAAASFVVLGGLVPYSLVDWAHSRATTPNMVLGYLVVLLSAARLTATVCRRRTQFMTAVCYIFIYVFVGIASLAQVVSRQYPLDNRDYAASAVTHQLVVLIAGCLAFEIGLQAASRLSGFASTARGTVAGSEDSPFSPWGLSSVRAALVAILGLAFVAWQVSQHGISSFFVSRELTTALLAGHGPESGPLYQATDKALGLLTTFLSQYLVFIALVVILYARRRKLWSRSKQHQELGWQLLIGLLVLANVVMNNPLGNGRWWFCLVIVSLVSVYLPVNKRANVAIYTIGALLVLLFAFTYLDAFRTTDRAETRTVAHGLASESYPVLQMGLNGDEYVSVHGYTQGRQLLGAALTLIPRRVWSDKPIPTGQLVDPQYLRSASAWTELYVDFGTPGVVIFFAIFGLFVRFIEDRAERSGPSAVDAFFPLFATYQLFLLRGSFMPAFGSLYQLLLLALFLVAPGPQRSALSRPVSKVARG